MIALRIPRTRKGKIVAALLIANEIRALLMTAPIWAALWEGWIG